MTELYTKLAEILEEDVVQPDDVLRDFEEWDSLSALSIVALANTAYGVTLTAEDLAGLKTAGDLVALISSRKA